LYHGPAKWSYAERMYGREMVLLQSSKAEDNGQDSELVCAVQKTAIVNKSASINFQFRASGPGIVGIVFKYVDEKNLYSFEIGGGDDVNRRFFQIRKKYNNSWSVIKRFNTNEEVSQLPFFGYELKTWYAISIEILNYQITVYASLLGTTAKMMVMRVEDDSMKNGLVGLCSSGTEVAFAEFGIRPLPIPKSI